MTISATIFELAAAGDTDAVARRIIDGFSDVNSVNREGFSALHFAVQEGHVELAEYLLANEAEVNLANRTGVTPIFMVVLAPQSKQVVLTKLLLAQRASVITRNQYGTTARDYLLMLGSKLLRDWIEDQRRGAP